MLITHRVSNIAIRDKPIRDEPKLLTLKTSNIAIRDEIMLITHRVSNIAIRDKPTHATKDSSLVDAVPSKPFLLDIT
jgi:hypothetical protein